MTTAGTPNAGMTPPSPTTEPYKLRRARKGRMLAGVAQGLATASGLDVTVVRICLGASMLTGLGVIAYILLWVVIPEEQPSRGRFLEPAPEGTARVIRVVLLGGALLVLLQRLNVFRPFGNANGHNTFGFDGLLALVLLSLGIGVLVSRYRSDAWSEPASPSPSSTPTSAAAATSTAAPVAEPFTPWSAPSVTRPAYDNDSLLDEEADDELSDDRVGFVGPLRDAAETVHRDVTQAFASARTDDGRTKKPGGAALGWARVVGWLVLLWWIGGLLLVLGLWRFGAVNITAPAVLFTAAWIVFTVVINALIRVRKPTLLLATLLALLIPLGIGQGTVEPDGPVGARILRPLTLPESVTYRQSIGELELDFSDSEFNTTRSTNIDARMGTGAIVVTLPDNVSVTVVSRIDAGAYDVLGKRTAGGIGQRETLRFEGCEGAPHVQLRLRGGAGYLEVNRESGNDPVCTPAA